MASRRRGAAVLTVLGAAALTLGLMHEVRAADSASLPRTITVNGEGEISAKPDSAQLSAGVVTQAPSAAAAVADNTKAMDRVFAALKSLGIPEARIRTENFSVQPQYRRDSSGEARAIDAYQVSNQVAVTLDDLARLGPTLDQLVRSGANQLNGVSFSIANPKPLAERARSAAVADAMAKAKTLAAAAGVTLGPLLSIDEGTGYRPVPVFARALATSAAAPPPTAIGEESVTVNVTMTYGIQ